MIVLSIEIFEENIILLMLERKIINYVLIRKNNLISKNLKISILIKEILHLKILRGTKINKMIKMIL